MEEMNKSIKYVKGVGEARAKLLEKLGIHTVGDMLYFFPRYVEDRSSYKSIHQWADGETVYFQGTVYREMMENRIKRNMVVYTLIVENDGEFANMVWFNNKYLKNVFEVGKTYQFYGKVSVKYGKKQITNPTYEALDSNLHTGRVVPTYALTDKLYQKNIRAIAKNCLDMMGGKIKEYIPAWVREEYGLSEINYAISSIHFPQNMDDYNIARYRLVFEELLMLQLGLFSMKQVKHTEHAPVIPAREAMQEFKEKLPFSLTGAQQNVLQEIAADLEKDTPMSRLVQGDVGSGKTVVAFAAIWAAVQQGMQGALMAPTEVLASQHYETALHYFAEDEVALLTGSVTGKKKQETLARIGSGSAKCVIGTHALIEDAVGFANLGLVVTDEQHRFGVNQRAKLSQKGGSPHMLVMSATPIPRTLALILYGDLDISVVNEMPPGRTPVKTYVIEEELRDRAYGFVGKHIAAGRQAYVVCPLVEESEKIDTKAATELAGQLAMLFPQYQVELLHGKMRPKQKNEIMQRFAAGETQILVSTTVIEVGVNVPNATVMVVENAERFGLSQLHQIRGRVGRGCEQSFCILFNQGKNQETRQRLGIMAKTTDGFEIARKDLELRGPGDFLGTRQHGMPTLKIADLLTDVAVLKEVQAAAKKLLRQDPQLKKEEHRLLREKIRELFRDKVAPGTIS